jgi:hypothetical protein
VGVNGGHKRRLVDHAAHIIAKQVV